MKIFHTKIINEPVLRRLILMILDTLLLFISFIFSFWILSEKNISFSTNNYFLIIFAPIIVITIYKITGQYKGITKYTGSSSFYLLIGRSILASLIIFQGNSYFGIQTLSIKFWIIFCIINTFLIFIMRILLRDIILRTRSSKQEKLKRVAIYGAGSAGAQLAASIHLENNYLIENFIDDNRYMWGRYLYGIKIIPPESISTINSKIDKILIAIPSISRSKRRTIINKLKSFNVTILQVPSLEELTNGTISVNTLQPIAMEDLLGRDTIFPNSELLKAGINKSIICVTGAGGSIGSELCRQILKLNPKKLVLLDNSELNLYSIQKELKAIVPNNIALKAVLGSATNPKLVKKILKSNGIQILFHAAAYKHVPMVEENPIQGIYNNVISTYVICQAALEESLKKVVLISTDKAVRPTNVMGASKRLAEIIIQAYQDKVNKNQTHNKTYFYNVRFGNVLGSSGSVVPLFTNQIATGGPITLTHPDVIRYFMTTKEAAQLVIQTLELSKGGDVFLLNMGEAVRIKSLAEEMVKLSGLSIHNDQNPDGDIEIVYTGLRPGEKLYEELLIDAESISTKHPYIFRANEKLLEPNLLWPKLRKLEYSLDNRDKETSLEILSELVSEWSRCKTN